jgi:hypothetical protein
MFLRPRVCRLIVFCFVGVTVAIGMGHAAETYRNAKYGFSVEVPTGVKLCTDPPPNPNHGAGLLLDPSISCEALPDAEPSINVIAGFNSIEKQNLEELKNYTCNGNGSRGTVPYGLTIPGHKTSSCLVKSGNGKVEVWIVAQVSTGAFIDGWINYEISLFTTEARLDKDLLTLRRVLGGIRLFRPL